MCSWSTIQLTGSELDVSTSSTLAIAYRPIHAKLNAYRTKIIEAAALVDKQLDLLLCQYFVGKNMEREQLFRSLVLEPESKAFAHKLLRGAFEISGLPRACLSESEFTTLFDGLHNLDAERNKYSYSDLYIDVRDGRPYIEYYESAKLQEYLSDAVIRLILDRAQSTLALLERLVAAKQLALDNDSGSVEKETHKIPVAQIAPVIQKELVARKEQEALKEPVAQKELVVQKKLIEEKKIVPLSPVLNNDIDINIKAPPPALSKVEIPKIELNSVNKLNIKPAPPVLAIVEKIKIEAPHTVGSVEKIKNEFQHLLLNSVAKIKTEIHHLVSSEDNEEFYETFRLASEAAKRIVVRPPKPTQCSIEKIDSKTKRVVLNNGEVALLRIEEDAVVIYLADKEIGRLSFESYEVHVNYDEETYYHMKRAVIEGGEKYKNQGLGTGAFRLFREYTGAIVTFAEDKEIRQDNDCLLVDEALYFVMSLKGKMTRGEI